MVTCEKQIDKELVGKHIRGSYGSRDLYKIQVNIYNLKERSNSVG